MARTVTDLYSSVLGRAPDAGGLQNWTNQFGDDVDDNEYSQFVTAAQPELQSRGQTGGLLSQPMTVTDAYNQVLNRTPDLAGKNYWTGQFGDTVDANELNIFKQAAIPELESIGPGSRGAFVQPYQNQSGTTTNTNMAGVIGGNGNVGSFTSANPTQAGNIKSGLDAANWVSGVAAQGNTASQNYGANQMYSNTSLLGAANPSVTQDDLSRLRSANGSMTDTRNWQKIAEGGYKLGDIQQANRQLWGGGYDIRDNGMGGVGLFSKNGQLVQNLTYTDQNGKQQVASNNNRDLSEFGLTAEEADKIYTLGLGTMYTVNSPIVADSSQNWLVDYSKFQGSLATPSAPIPEDSMPANGIIPAATRAGTTGANGGAGGAGGTGGTTVGTGGGAAGTPASGSGNWAVPDENTVLGRFLKTTAAGTPLDQMARTSANQQMNSRGLLNSSLAISAADQAAYQAALPIANADANLLNNAAQFNADWVNKNAQTQAELNNRLQLANLNNAANLQQAQLQSDTQKWVTSTNNTAQRDLAEINNRNQVLQTQLNNQNRLDLQNLTSSYQQVLQTQVGAADLYKQAQVNITNILASSSMNDAAKQTAIQNQLALLKNGLEIQGELGGISGLDQLLNFSSIPTVTGNNTTQTQSTQTGLLSTADGFGGG